MIHIIIYLSIIVLCITKISSQDLVSNVEPLELKCTMKNPVQSVSRRKRYEIQGSKWDKNHLTWR